MTQHLNLRAQFAHLNMAGLARSQSKRTKETKWTASQLLAEADRIPGNASHVKNPLPPNWLKGSRALVEARAETWRAQAREAGGKARLRATSPSVACAVVSWPREREHDWERYRDDVIAYFERTVAAERIPGVVEHLDESHQHIHVYFVPLDGEDFGAVHPGYAARARARKLKGNHVRVAYNEAMRRWQDDLYVATGKPHGLERASVRRMRLSRADYLSRKNAAKLKADAEAEARELLATASAEAKLAAQRMADANKAHRQLVNDAKLLDSERLRFAQEPAGMHAAALAQRDAEVKRLQKETAELRTALDAAMFRIRQYEEREAATKARRMTPGP